MSRCFPYPPPGYDLTNSRKEALIESIKFQKENVKAEEPRKKDRKEKEEKKKEKKERRKEKKEKRKVKKDDGIWNHDKSGIVHGHIGENFWSDAKADFLRKGSCSESEQLERSSLTEEHAKPVCLGVPSTSSDSTENSNKRKRPQSPVDSSRGHGKIIRIRLTSKKQNQPSVDEEKHCSTSGRTQFPAEAGRSEAFCSTSRSSLVPKQIGAVPVLEKLLSTPLQKEGLLYKNLMDNLTSPGFRDGCVDADDEDWLFGAKNRVERSEKGSIWRKDMAPTSCHNASSLWPGAQYLPEVGICALPFTLPF